MRKLQYILIGLGAIVLFGVVFMFAGMGTVRNLKIESVSMAGVADGTYRGEYKHARWNYTVDVTVRDHKIAAITQIGNGTGNQVVGKMTDELTGKIVGQNSTDVDVVSGATVTSKAFLKAVENALASASK